MSLSRLLVDNERSRHQTDFINSDDTDSERSRRQTNSTRNATSDHDGSGSGGDRVCCMAHVIYLTLHEI